MAIGLLEKHFKLCVQILKGTTRKEQFLFLKAKVEMGQMTKNNPIPKKHTHIAPYTKFLNGSILFSSICYTKLDVNNFVCI
jgi:hypothetical protein